MFERMFYRKYQRELLLVFFTIAIAGFLNYTIVTDTAFLNFYNMVVVVAAFFLGRRVATLSAVFSILVVVGLTMLHSEFLEEGPKTVFTKAAAMTA